MTHHPQPHHPDRIAAQSKHRRLPLLVLLLLTAVAAPAQLPAGTTDASSSSQPQSTRPAEDPQRTAAADALGHGDFRTALNLLHPLAEKYPSDAHVLFDLASAQDALDQTGAAEVTYRQAIAADSTYLEPHLALGLLLARNHREADARTELRLASTLRTPDPSLQARAYRALARLDLVSDPAEARDSLIAALKLTPETIDDTLLSAELAGQAQDPAAAEAAYRRVLKRSPDHSAATVSLSRLLIAQNRPAEAEPLLTSAIAAHPDDPALAAQQVTLYLREDKLEPASNLAASLHAAHPENPAITRLYARLLSQTGQYERSEPLFAGLSAQDPNDPTLLDDHADALIHLKRYAEAQQLLTLALSRPAAFPTPGDMGSAASHLAFAATQNNDPNAVLRALDQRAKVLPQSSSSIFLEAAAHDKLHHTRQASDLYKQFLAVANGKFPDEEWEARHRLIALDHTK